MLISIAICGLGSDHVVGIAADHEARVDLDDLRAHLEASLANQQAVYAVVAIIGSTEEGAVDPLRGILAMRDSYQARGLSFVVHADAAWGATSARCCQKTSCPTIQTTLKLLHRLEAVLDLCQMLP